MQSVARGVASLVSTVKWQAGRRGLGMYAPAGALSGCRGIHMTGGNDGPARLSLVMSSRGLAAIAPHPLRGQTQTRSFKKANYVEKIVDNEKAQEVLEALEVRDDETDAQPPRQALNDNGEKPPSAQENTESDEDMTKGEVIPDYLFLHLLTRPGKMLTTPSRLFKLILPLTTVGREGEDKGKAQATAYHQPILILNPRRGRTNCRTGSPTTTPLLPRASHPVRTSPDQRAIRGPPPTGRNIHRPPARRQRDQAPKTRRRRPLP